MYGRNVCKNIYIYVQNKYINIYMCVYANNIYLYVCLFFFWVSMKSYPPTPHQLCGTENAGGVENGPKAIPSEVAETETIRCPNVPQHVHRLFRDV